MHHPSSPPIHVPGQPHVGVVILNWNGLSDLLECLASVTQSSYQGMTVIVVDNGSADETLSAVPAQYPTVTLIATGENLGWAGGNNVGIRHALKIGCTSIFLLNNDTTLSPDCIELLMQTSTQTGANLLHPSIYYYDEPTVAQLDPLENQPQADRTQVVAIDHAYGAALLLSAELIQQVGLIDERFFLQMEETDFYYRAKKLGFKSYVMPQARVLHKESRSFGTRISPVKSYYIVRNSLLLLSKHTAAMGGWRKGLRNLFWTVSQMIAREQGQEQGQNHSSAVANLRWLFSRNASAKAITSGIADFLLGRFGPIRPQTATQIKSLMKA